MGLGMKEQSVPEMMRVLRLVAAAPSGVCDNKISWMVNSRPPARYGHTFWDYMMAVIMLSSEPDWLIDCLGGIDHGRWAVTRLHQSHSVGADGQQRQRSSHRVQGQGLQVFASHFDISFGCLSFLFPHPLPRLPPNPVEPT